MEKLIIAAICGAEVTKKHNPRCPTPWRRWCGRPRALLRRARRCPRPCPRGRRHPTQDRERFRVVLDAIKEACPGVILIPPPARSA